MSPLTLKLDTVNLSDEQFYHLCQNNRELKFERTAKGELIIMSPVGNENRYILLLKFASAAKSPLSAHTLHRSKKYSISLRRYASFFVVCDCNFNRQGILQQLR